MKDAGGQFKISKDFVFFFQQNGFSSKKTLALYKEKHYLKKISS